MLKKILNILLVLAIVALIGFVLVNLYNKSKLDTDNFNKTSEKVKKDDSKKDSDKKNSKIASDTNDKNTSNSDGNNTSNSSNNNDSEEETSTDDLSSSLVSVESTSSYKNTYIYIIGCITILAGLSKVIVKIKN